MKEILIQFLSKAFNMPADTAASLFNEDGTGFKPDALNVLLEADKKKVESFTTQINNLKVEKDEAFDKGHKKAKSETLDGQEKEIKDAFNFKSDLKGLDLFKEIVAANTKPSKDVTDDVVQKHPVYQALVIKAKKDMDDAVNEVKGEMTKMQTEQKRKETLGKANKFAIKHFEEIGAIENEDAAIKATQRDLLLLGSLNGFDYEFDDNDPEKDPIVKKDGKLYTNAHGHAIPFAEIIKEITSKNFGIKAATERGAAGGKENNGGGGAGKGAFKVTRPKNREDYLSQYNNLKAANLPKDDYNKSVIELDKQWEEVKVAGV